MSKLATLAAMIGVGIKDLAGVRTALDPPRGRFVLGINLGGDAITVQGERWQSQSEALAGGVNLPDVKMARTRLAPVPHAEPDTRAMLNSVVFRDRTLDIALPLAAGSYELYFWIMENYQTHWHSLALRIAGQPVAEGLGRLQRSEWRRYGPFPALHGGGVLQLTLDTGTPGIDAHLMGLSVYSHRGEVGARQTEG